ncbi:SAF domain-containing protein [Corynebacterium lowii]|uniref:SAF domain protein n=1 Tax=Corynebacterium lowii TaxID=1544413 RepID=A0A0Q0UI07_9CORY|nr:SAF domain-containing protein [Corynebacterium lowii]KQB86011.1 SAF domain protein [Corynebacterium lowii]MDP9850559.1 hypothetical protein [Corynebacterium lowii]
MFARLLSTLRTPGWRRTALLRRFLALLLILLAAALALRPQGTPALFFRAEVATGQEITAEHVEVRRAPAHLIPSSALASPEEALGKVLIAPAVAGEPVTPTRFLAPVALAGRVAVPVPLDTPEDVLHHGDEVSVVSQGEIIATGATVLLPPDAQHPTALLALPEETAARVAATALDTPLTVLLSKVGYSAPRPIH